MPPIGSSALNTGVYCLKNLVDGKVYVGSSSRSLTARISTHYRTLNKGRSHNEYLQRAWSKYGPKSFTVFVLQYCTPERCISREQYWIDTLGAADREKGYNLAPKAGSTLGLIFPQAGRNKISMANSLRTEEARAKISAAISAARKSHKITESTRAKLSAAGRGRKHTAEERAKMSASMKGRQPTLETREKMSVAKLTTRPCKDCGRPYHRPKSPNGGRSKTWFCVECRSIVRCGNRPITI